MTVKHDNFICKLVIDIKLFLDLSIDILSRSIFMHWFMMNAFANLVVSNIV